MCQFHQLLMRDQLHLQPLLIHQLLHLILIFFIVYDLSCGLPSRKQHLSIQTLCFPIDRRIDHLSFLQGNDQIGITLNEPCLQPLLIHQLLHLILILFIVYDLSCGFPSRKQHLSIQTLCFPVDQRIDHLSFLQGNNQIGITLNKPCLTRFYFSFLIHHFVEVYQLLRVEILFNVLSYSPGILNSCTLHLHQVDVF